MPLPDPTPPKELFHRYLVANLEVWSNVVLPGRRIRRTEVPKRLRELGFQPWGGYETPVITRLEGRGQVAGLDTAYEAQWRGAEACRLWLDGHGQFEIQRLSHGILLYFRGDQAPPDDILLGPPLLLVLTLGSIYTLHASALTMSGRSIAFCGESGAGKSTVAALFARRGWRRLADDQLAVHCDGGPGLGAPQPLPQLKLPQQDRGSGPPPLTTVYALKPSQRQTSRFTRLQGGQAVHEVLAAITPFSLYSPSLGGRALAAVGRAVSTASLKVHRIDYPHRPQALEEVYREIAEDSTEVLSA
ncbi:MAG: hypothetical protein AAF604_22440 [Acidobacteriota bacterium]